MKLADVKRVGQVKGKDFEKMIILTQANNEAGHRIQDNVVGFLMWFVITDDEQIVFFVSTAKGMVEAFVKFDWAVIFPTKAHPLYKG